MDNTSISKADTKRNKKSLAKPSCSAIAKKGFAKSSQLLAFECAALADMAEGLIASSVGNAMANMTGKLLKTKELEFKYGRLDSTTQEKVFLLTT
jgi:hypothetical protein